MAIIPLYGAMFLIVIGMIIYFKKNAVGFESNEEYSQLILN
jgi:hypothetical protein